MIKLFRRKQQNAEQLADDQSLAIAEKPSSAGKRGLFQRLSKTRHHLFNGVATAVLGKKQLDEEMIEWLETQLLLADVGVQATEEIVSSLSRSIARKSLSDPKALMNALKQQMVAVLQPVTQPLVISQQNRPFIIFVVGVNGAGKTTTIGKLVKRLQLEGKSVMLAAGDTFRAAAVEQLQVWGKRNSIRVIAQKSGADSASVAFDAVSSAIAQKVEVLIIDTAGRLHNQDHLMAELQKIKRVVQKQCPDAPDETLLVMDAGNGQNALMQAKKFTEAINVSGICLTKLDGTAKGGIVFAIAKQLALPLRLVGVGESIEDLRDFNADEFVDALFDELIIDDSR